MQNCVKCNKTRTDWCNSLGLPRHMFLTKPHCHNCPNKCSMRALYHPCTSLYECCQAVKAPFFLPMNGERSTSPAFSGSPWWGEINMATSPLPSQGQTLHRGRTAGALRVHYGHMYQRPPKGEGGRKHQACGCGKHADAVAQHNNLILRCVKSVVLTDTNPNCYPFTMQRHTRGAHVQMTCATLQYIFMPVST